MLTNIWVPNMYPRCSKSTPPLGPFPRYIWVHPDTPYDSLDKACYEIWKLAQALQKEFNPSQRNKSTSTEGTEKKKKDVIKEKSSDLSDEKDEIRQLVDQEYMNLIIENIDSIELNGLLLNSREKSPINTVPDFLKLTVKKLFKSLRDEDNEMRNVMQDHIIISSNIKTCKTNENSKRRNKRKAKRQARAIEDFLKNSIINKNKGSKCDINAIHHSIDKILSKQLLPEKKRLPVFTKICSKTDGNVAHPKVLSAAEDSRNLEMTSIDNERLDTTRLSINKEIAISSCKDIKLMKPVKDSKEVLVSSIPSKAPADKEEDKSETHSKQKGEISADAPVTATPSSKANNNEQHTESISKPQTSASAKKPPYLLNYPDWTHISGASFPYYQHMYQQRLRMSYAQALQGSFGWYPTTTHPYNPLQLPQMVLCAPFIPINYIAYAQPDLSSQMRNSSKSTPLAADGLQYLFPFYQWYNAPVIRPSINSQHLSSTGKGKKPV